MFLPWLYLKGISTGDFHEALHALFGHNAKGLSASTISRCKLVWEKALRKVYPETEHQRCWVHKTANVLNKLPKVLQPKVKQALQTRADTYKSFDAVLCVYLDNYPTVMECHEKGKKELLAFYDYPAAHWQHIRTSNPIGPTFATVRLRTTKTRGCVVRHTILSMVYKLGQSVQKQWRRLRGFKQPGAVIRGV
ncbi:MAG: hypothetical protein D3909_05825 [Candidatus Electrothrix sp. ATG1]|nr:hypothetical protein [Candidatus Electrothrix sp. ATG1]